MIYLTLLHDRPQYRRFPKRTQIWQHGPKIQKTNDRKLLIFAWALRHHGRRTHLLGHRSVPPDRHKSRILFRDPIMVGFPAVGNRLPRSFHIHTQYSGGNVIGRCRFFFPVEYPRSFRTEKTGRERMVPHQP